MSSQVVREALLSKAFVSLADTLLGTFDIVDLLDRLVGYSMELLDANGAGVMIVDQAGSLQVLASSNEDAHTMELFQLQADEGPCVACVRSAAAVSIPDLEQTVDRWPRLSAAMADHGVFRSVHAVPLRLRGQAVGALNLFRFRPGAMQADELAMAQALADIATIALLQERALQHAELTSEQLQGALVSRVVIEQAKGVLAERGALSMNAAFGHLRDYARGTNKRLSDVAGGVVAGDLLLDDLLGTGKQR